MERRKFVIGLGSLAAGGAAAMGSGAFTSVEAERKIAMGVADDSDALLELEPTEEPNGDYATTTSGQAGDILELNFDEVDGEGFNSDAETWICNIFTVANQGTQPVEVGFSNDGGAFRTSAKWRWSADSDVVNASSPRNAETIDDAPCEETVYKLRSPGQASLPVIDSGEQFTVHLYVNTTEGSGAHDGELTSVTITAEEAE